SLGLLNERYNFMGIRLLPLIMLGVSLVSSTLPAFSQEAADDCQPQIRQALQQVGDLCNNLSRNSACYGNSTIKATFVDQASTDQVAKPGDTTAVNSLQSIETAPLDETSNTWGVSLLRLQANVPDTLPGQGVVFVLYGDVSIENAVSPDDAFTPA